MFNKVFWSLLFAGVLFGIMAVIFHFTKDDATIKQPFKVVEKVNVVFWDENAGPDRTPYYKKLIQEFEEQNPTIHIEYIGLPKQTAKQKIDSAIASNDLPDVCGVQTSWLADFTSRKVLLDLDPLFAQWDEKDRLSPAIIESNREMVLDKKLYQMPNTMSMEILWYRPDWFAKEQVKVPDTWDEFFYAVEKMTDKDKQRYGFSIRGGNGASIQLLRMMFAYSGFTDFFDKNGKCRINDPKHVEFVKKYLALYQKFTPISDVTNGYREMIAAFDMGNVAMVQHNIGSYSQHQKSLKPGEYAPLPLPKAVNGDFIQEGGNIDGYSIFNTSKHPKEAWLFISFLCSQKSQSYWNKSIGQIPTHMDSLQEPWAQELPHMQLALRMFSNPNLKFYQPPMYLPDYRSMLDQTGDQGIQAVMIGKKSVEEFLNEWALVFERSKQRYDIYTHSKK